MIDVKHIIVKSIKSIKEIKKYKEYKTGVVYASTI